MAEQRNSLILQSGNGAGVEDRTSWPRSRLRRLWYDMWSVGGLRDDPMSMPYSSRAEIRFFFSKGVPLGLAALMNFGIPPLVAMAFAGHTGHSSRLQASLGYARVWYNCTMLMTQSGTLAYFRNVIPGCIGAGRKDRLPSYFRRSVLFSLLSMLPFYILQFLAADIMSACGVPRVNAEDVGCYCRLMIMTSMVQLVNSHMESAFNNLGYAKCSTLNSFLTGLGVDCTSTFLFIYLWRWDMVGAALSRLLVNCFRLTVWFTLTYYYKLAHDIFIVSDAGVREPLFSMTEFREFGRLGIPQVFTYFAGWLVFEFQLMGIANIKGITQDALAAGADWVQFETATAAAQMGWLSSTAMRILALLGRQDPGARDAFNLFQMLAAFSVAIANIFFLFFQEDVCRLMSNDMMVQQWLRKIIWLLVLHSQTRISALAPNFLWIPLGRGLSQIVMTFTAFYVIAAPIVGLIALTDVVTKSVEVKLTFCISLASIAQFVMVIWNSVILCKLDWQEAGAIVYRRANTDRQHRPATSTVSHDEPDKPAASEDQELRSPAAAA